MNRRILTVALLLLGSGGAALVYQTGWFRLLRLVFGSTTAATAAVLAVFMAGLGLGGLILGRRADRHEQPLRLYAMLEFGVSLTALASPWLIDGVRWLYLGVGGSSVLGPTVATGLRLVLAGTVLLVPTFLMGGTLPAAARAVESAGDRGRRAVGILYGANTIGAVLGAFCSTFFFLEVLGTQQTIWVAGLFNLLIAMLARRLARRFATEVPTVETAAAPASPEAPVTAEAGARSLPIVWIYTAAFVTGFSFFLMELVWYRILTPLLGGSVYTFGLILAVALAGIGFGGALYGAGASSRRPSLWWFAATCVLEAAVLAVPLALGDQLALGAWFIRPLASLGFGGLVLAWTAITVVLVLPAAIITGVQFPMLIALFGEGRSQVGDQIGRVYGANTLGTIVGSLAGGFGMIPWLGATGTWRVAAATLVALSVSAIVLAWRRQPRLRYGVLIGATAAVAVLMLSATGPSALWRHTGIGVGRLPLSFKTDRNEITELRHRMEFSVQETQDGIEAGLGLDTVDGMALIVNGKSDGNVVYDAANFVMSGLVGTMLHPAPKRVLNVGLGTGMTAGWVAAVSDVERVDVIELEAGVVDLARRMNDVSLGAVGHPKVHLTIADAREVLQTTDERYDLIMSEPSNPYRAGVAALFTSDFYESVVARLESGGMFLQWVQGYEVDAGTVRTVLATVASVFPYVELWRLQHSDMLLVAAQEPIAHDLDLVRRRAQQQPYRQALGTFWGVQDADGFYGGYLAGDPVVRALYRLRPDRLNTDDRTLIEFEFARSLGRPGSFQLEDLRTLARQLGHGLPPVTGPTGIEAAALVDAWGAASLQNGAPLDTSVANPAVAARNRARAAYQRGDFGAAEAAWRTQPERPRHPVDTIMLADVLARKGAVEVLPVAEQLADQWPAQAAAVAAQAHVARGDAPQAVSAVVAAYQALRRSPWFWPLQMNDLLQQAHRLALSGRGVYAERILDDALGEELAGSAGRYFRMLMRQQIVRDLQLADRCREVYEVFEPTPFWDYDALFDRARCYATFEHPLLPQAHVDVEAFQAAAPRTLARVLAEAGYALDEVTDRRP